MSHYPTERPSPRNESLLATKYDSDDAVANKLNSVFRADWLRKQVSSPRNEYRHNVLELRLFIALDECKNVLNNLSTKTQSRHHSVQMATRQYPSKFDKCSEELRHISDRRKTLLAKEYECADKRRRDRRFCARTVQETETWMRRLPRLGCLSDVALQA